MVVNGTAQMLNAALSGLGLAFMLEDVVREPIAQGLLRPVLDDWWPTFSGYHLYYPGRRQPSSDFLLLADALRYAGRCAVKPVPLQNCSWFF
jgi:DNA-binding transcriptional LysR family regulator